MDSEGVEVEEPTPVDLALAAYEASFDQLLGLVEDGGLEEHDDLALVAVMQRFERLRNRQSLVDHRLVRDGQARRLPERFTQRSMTVVLAKALRISHGEAARRVRAAEQVGERLTMTGQPLPVLRPALAEVQRSGQASAEQVDIVLRVRWARSTTAASTRPTSRPASSCSPASPRRTARRTFGTSRPGSSTGSTPTGPSRRSRSTPTADASRSARPRTACTPARAG